MRALYWHIDRWRKSTAYSDMTTEEQGAYRNLLDEAALREDGIPDDERILARVACGGDAKVWKRVRVKVLERFVGRDGKLHNATLERVLQASQTRIDRQQRYRDRVAAERNEPRNAKRNDERQQPRNEGRYPYPDPDVQEQVPGRQAVPERRARAARPARPPVENPHDQHEPELCGWVCLPREFVRERLPQAGGASRDDLVRWALATRDTFGDAPVDPRRPFDFWRARWSEATESLTATAEERQSHALYQRSFGALPLLEFVRQRRRGSAAGPVAPVFAPFITRKDQTA